MLTFVSIQNCGVLDWPLLTLRSEWKYKSQEILLHLNIDGTPKWKLPHEEKKQASAFYISLGVPYSEERQSGVQNTQIPSPSYLLHSSIPTPLYLIATQNYGNLSLKWNRALSKDLIYLWKLFHKPCMNRSYHLYFLQQNKK